MANQKILVITSAALLREQLKQILTHAGFETHAAASSAAALELARQHTFDGAMIETRLPDALGSQIFRQLRALHPEMAGILITEQSAWELTLDALNAGFVGFVLQPIVSEQIIATVVTALEREKVHREKARWRAIAPLFELSRTFMGNFTLDELLQHIVAVAQRETRARTVSLMLLDPGEQELRIVAAVGLPPDVIASQRVPVGHGIAGRVAQQGEPMLLTENSRVDPEIRRLMKKPEVLSSLSLPLRVRNRVIGVLNLSRQYDDEPFHSGDLEMATIFAEQAALAIDQTRLFEQLRALNEITQSLASAVDLEDALTMLVRAPARLVDARTTTLWLNNSVVPPITLDTLTSNEAVLVVPHEHIQAQLTTHTTTHIVLPLQHSDRMVGALAVQLPAPSAAREERLGVLRTLTHTASAVIETLSARVRQVGALRQVDDVLRANLNLQQLLQRLLTEMLSICEADGGAIFLRSTTENRLEVWCTFQFSDGDEVAQTIMREGRTQVLSHARHPHTTFLGAPLVIGGHPNGAVVLSRAVQTGRFTHQHIEWLTTLANIAALAIRNAQLYARSEEAAIIEERTRIARELHDGLAQDLTYLVLKINVAQKLASQGRLKELHKELQEIAEQLRRDMRDVRHTIFALRPIAIETEGFLPALQKFVKEFGMFTEIEVHLDVQGPADQLPSKMETALFRLTQEALNNVRKHARARHVWIELNVEAPRTVSLRVRDDGVGFSPKILQSARERGSIGLVQMRERAERAGGTFEIQSAPGKGTLVYITLPLER